MDKAICGKNHGKVCRAYLKETGTSTASVRTCYCAALFRQISSNGRKK